jgi:hypothetical protein
VLDRCVFCGTEGEDFAPEHWIPKWLSRAIIPKHSPGAQHFGHGRTWTKTYFDLTVKHVCNECNHGWMSTLEDDAKGIALPLILGQDAPHREDEQKTLASWCYLKAISLELGREGDDLIGHPPTYPVGAYIGFKQHGYPPPYSSVVYLGVREIRETSPTFVWWASQRLKFPGNPPVPEVDGYTTTLLIGHLAIRVMGILAAGRLKPEGDDWWSILWPDTAGEAFRWPPPKRFSGIVDDELV